MTQNRLLLTQLVLGEFVCARARVIEREREWSRVGKVVCIF